MSERRIAQLGLAAAFLVLVASITVLVVRGGDESSSGNQSAQVVAKTPVASMDVSLSDSMAPHATGIGR